MAISEDLEALELFNRKAEILKNSSFMKFLLEQDSGISISWGIEDEPMHVETRWPGREAMRSLILTLRFFIQNNEKSSFENMETTYDNLPISQEKKEQFKNARKRLNKYLDTPSPFQISKEQPTNRHIMEAFIYGEFAHASERWKQMVDQWMSCPFASVVRMNEFIHILGNVTGFITYVQQLNEEVIEELSEKQ